VKKGEGEKFSPALNFSSREGKGERSQNESSSLSEEQEDRYVKEKRKKGAPTSLLT